MQLLQELYDLCLERAKNTKVACLSIGLSYTAVLTDDGGMGIAYTYMHDNPCCSSDRDYRDFENESAVELLGEIKSPFPIRRSMALALINALNHREAGGCPADDGNGTWMDALHIGKGTHVAMVGFFRPLMDAFNERGAEVEALDEFQGIGERDEFFEKLEGWTDVLLLTSTSILNDTTEDILERLSPGVKAVMLGPSTPMIAGAFRHLPVRALAGTVPVDKESILKAIRHGVGTPVLRRFCRKVFLMLD